MQNEVVTSDLILYDMRIIWFEQKLETALMGLWGCVVWSDFTISLLENKLSQLQIHYKVKTKTQRKNEILGIFFRVVAYLALAWIVFTEKKISRPTWLTKST